MDILIPNLELPEKGNVALMLYADGSVEICGKGSLSKPSFGTPTVKAVELPPHGAVIDLETLPVHSNYFDVVVKKQDLLNNMIYRCDGGK